MTTVLVTGAGGEIGHSLLTAFQERGGYRVIAMDLRELDAHLASMADVVLQGDVADAEFINGLDQYDIDEVYHLAALLSTSAEKKPDVAHNVNVNGTMNLLMMSRRIALRRGSVVKFLFPSTIAVYGIRSIEAKNASGKVLEDQFLTPTTMYGVNKVYCEQLGGYMSDHFGQLTDDAGTKTIDFRAVRFPGLISATTVPSGGTSDYAPEMIHAAAKGEPYACFVRPDTRIPFMAMPDGVKALLDLAAAPAEDLTRRVYNIGAFAPSAAEIEQHVKAAFPEAQISYAPHPKRQAIVDTWCADVNDEAARNDWGWSPEYDMDRAFNEYLIPTIGSVYER